MEAQRAAARAELNRKIADDRAARARAYDATRDPDGSWHQRPDANRLAFADVADRLQPQRALL